MRVLSLRDGTWSHGQAATTADVLHTIEEDSLTWVRAGGLEGAALDQLGEAFGLHALAIEDVQTARQRPKVEDYPQLTFVVVRVPRYADDELGWQQVGLFVGRDFLVTASTSPVAELDALEKRILEHGLPEGRRTSSDLLHFALDLIVDAWFPYMDALEDRIEEIEDEVVEGPTQDRLHDIRAMKGVVSRTRKVSGPMREAAQSLERAEHPNILAETRVYLRDVSDHMIRIAERLEHVKEMTLIAQESWNATLANQQNQVMKRLTVVAALLLIPSLAAGIGGMNFEQDFPPWNFWVVTAALLTFVVGGLSVAWWRKWL